MLENKPIPLPGQIQSLFAVVRFSIRQMFWTKKTLLIALVAVIPPLFAAFTIIAKSRFPDLDFGRPQELYDGLYTILYQSILLFLVPFLYAVSLLGDEIEGKTLHCLLTRPISKLTLLFGKLLAYGVIAFALFAPTMTVTRVILVGIPASSYTALSQDLIVLGVGLLVYGSVFTLMGLAFKKATVVAFLFASWENGFSYLPGFLQKMTTLHYLQTCSRVKPEQLIPQGILSVPTTQSQAIFTLAFVFVVATGLAAAIFSHREYRSHTPEA